MSQLHGLVVWPRVSPLITRGLDQAIVSPPLTDSVWPVMYSAASDAKKATAAATSEGWPRRFIGTERVMPPITLSASCPELSAKLRSAGVSVGPGQTVFTVTPLVATSRASVLVNAMMPPLAPE